MAQRPFLVWSAIILTPALANAQSPGHRASIDLKGSIGYAGFFDDDVNHLHTSVGARLYVTDRLSIEPEVQYSARQLPRRPRDRRQRQRGSSPRAGDRYVSGGIGVANGRDLFAQGGVGTKITMGESWFIAPDVRLGYYNHIRTSIGFGYAFGPAAR